MGPVYRAVCLFTPQRWSQYQIILLGDRGTCVNDLPKVVTWQCSGAESNLRLWVTSGLQVRHVAVRLPSHTLLGRAYISPSLCLYQPAVWLISGSSQTTYRDWYQTCQGYEKCRRTIFLLLNLRFFAFSFLHFFIPSFFLTGRQESKSKL